jgi:DNA-binding response OmpR family regulator
MPKLSILLVEDNPHEVELVCEALAGIDPGVEVHVAASVASAWALMDGMPADHRLSLVITDHHLPDGCGQDLIARLQACPTRQLVPVVMVSGDSQRPAGLGDIAWFAKPDTWAGWRALAQTLVERLAPR